MELSQGTSPGPDKTAFLYYLFAGQAPVDPEIVLNEERVELNGIGDFFHEEVAYKRPTEFFLLNETDEFRARDPENSKGMPRLAAITSCPPLQRRG